MIALKYSDVFVPGGFPSHTYNPRSSQQLETKLKEVLENLCKLVTVTGHTKSGKTVLVRTILPKKESIWVEGGGIGSEDDFWNTIIDQLALVQTTEFSNNMNITAELSASGRAGANFIFAKGEAEVGGTIGSSRDKGTSQTRIVSTKVTALAGLKRSAIPLVIDDFHYLSRNLQGTIVRALKPMIFDGLPVVIIAIPHRRYDALKVEKEMTGRILPIEVPTWTNDELRFIPETGFSKLNSTVSDSLLTKLALEAIGSPHLMQEFCRAICRLHMNSDTFKGGPIDPPNELRDTIFRDTAETIGRPIFEKLARGPRQRSDRIQRRLVSGETVDIYGLVLRALARLSPDLVTLEYEDLRGAIRDVSAKDPPQLHEVARVLKHMSEIAATDQSSTPVIDFDEEDKRLHVTDPFFAFYLRWGSLDN
jgi:hypothetical protein